MALPGEKSNEDICEDELFYFESGHLALKGNKDYSELLKTMVILESQRIKALEDFNKVVELKRECLENPIMCIEKLKSGSLGAPDNQEIVDVPEINWTKYSIKVPEQFIKQLDSNECSVQTENTNKKLSFTPWTTEEQRKLEQLLIKYPPEMVKAQRISKIAKELGTRTAKQIATRLQKYYLKLYKAGLPVPGKLLKHMSTKKKKVNEKKQINYIKQSTFFPELDIPVQMDESEEIPGPAIKAAAPKEPNNYLMTHRYFDNGNLTNVKDNADIQIKIIKLIKSEKIMEMNLMQLYQHIGFKCDFCDKEPIEGTRWHCSICDSNSVDYCTDCMMSQILSNKPHSLQHKFLIIRDDKVIVNTLDDSDEESEINSVKCNNEGSSSELSECDKSENDVDSDSDNEIDINKPSTSYAYNDY